MRQFHISKESIEDAQWVDCAAQDLVVDHIRLRLDIFSLTSNNVTYAAMGAGVLGYWDFFPVLPQGLDHGAPKGMVPVWGFGTVTMSLCDDINIGQRVYGYFPLAQTVDFHPKMVTSKRFIDQALARNGKSIIYNQYNFTDTDADYMAQYEAEQTLYRPLFATGWWACDYITQDFSNVDQIVISSASSKTAIAMAHCLKHTSNARLIGLTSLKNIDYLKGIGLYDDVLIYDDVNDLDGDKPSVFVDYLGRKSLSHSVHKALYPKLAKSILIGATDWSEKTPAPKEARLEVVSGSISGPILGPKPEFFFAPTYIEHRMKNAGVAILEAMRLDLRAYYAQSHAYCIPRLVTGEDEIKVQWLRLVEANIAPSDAIVCRFN